MFGLLRHVFPFSLKGECNKGLWLMYYLGHMLVLIIFMYLFWGYPYIFMYSFGATPFMWPFFLWNGYIWRARLGWSWVRGLLNESSFIC